MIPRFCHKNVASTITLFFLLAYTVSGRNNWKPPQIKSPPGGSIDESEPANRVHAISGSTAALQFLLAAETTTLISKKLDFDPTQVLLGTNIGLFVAWNMAEDEPELRRFMYRHCVYRSDDWKKNRPHTILLSGFSHKDYAHFTSNMSVLSLLAPKVAKSMGPRKFSYFYHASIYAALLFDHWVYSPRFGPPPLEVLSWTLNRRCLGASGAISSLVTYHCLKNPKDRIDLSPELGLEKQVEIPAWVLVVLSVSMDLFPGKDSNVGHGVHLGGYLFGAIVFIGEKLWMKCVTETGRTRKRRKIAERVNLRKMVRRFRAKVAKGAKSFSKDFGKFLRKSAKAIERNCQKLRHKLNEKTAGVEINMEETNQSECPMAQNTQSGTSVNEITQLVEDNPSS